MKHISTKAMSMISVSDERCDNIDIVTNRKCNQYMIIRNDKPYCFRCEVTAKEDYIIKQRSEQTIKNRKINEVVAAFKADSLINEDLQEATFATFTPASPSQQNALNEAKHYVNTFNKKDGLMIVGRSGVGKSHLSVAITKELMNKAYTCLFISIPRLLTEFKSTYDKNSEKTEMDLFRAIEQVDLLIFDDLGAERENAKDKSTAWAKRKLFEISDSRAGKATIYTSNYSGPELLHMYGERDFGRMVKNCHPITITGGNYRLKAFKKGGM